MAIDLQRRQKVMARSQKLGHCVCNVKKSCPCDVLIQANVCPCAGERPPLKAEPVRLLNHVAKAGCASKIGQGDLKRILAGLPPVEHPSILLGMAAGDDAGVWRLDERLALVQTVDVFTPCVDDPYLFGQIAAANSVSDVYAMGGRPLTALSIVGFPIDELDGSAMQAMLRGGMDKLAEAGCCLIGGHSLNDPEIKLGFAVTGLIDIEKVKKRGAARPGDVLVLTKPLGTGMIAFAAQLGRLSRDCLSEAGAAMATLNKDAAELMVDFEAHACTDVTGFGLAGHLVEMVRDSGVCAEIDFASLPVFAAAQTCLEGEILSGAIERNQEYAMAWIRNADPAHAGHLPILYDPQTSGGLLVSLPAERAEGYLAALHGRGHRAASPIGRITPKTSPDNESVITIVNARIGHFIGKKENKKMDNQDDPTQNPSSSPSSSSSTPDRNGLATPDSPCCEGISHSPSSSSSSSPDAPTGGITLALFTDFMKAANSPGLLDRRTKKLLAIALSIAARCAPCLKIHLNAALAMGLTMAEIDEAAALTIAFGGCSTMMFYKEILGELNLG